MTLIKTLVKHFDLEHVQLRNGELSKIKEKNVNRSIFFRELTCYLTKHLQLSLFASLHGFQSYTGARYIFAVLCFHILKFYEKNINVVKSPTCWLNLFPSVSSSCWSLRVRGHFQRTVSIHTFQFNLDTLGNWSVLFGKNSSYVRLSQHNNHNLFIRFTGDISE